MKLSKDDRWVVPVLALSDAAIIALCLLVGVWLRSSNLVIVFGLPAFNPSLSYATLWPMIPALVVARGIWGLYPGYGLSAPESLRRQTLGTLVVFMSFFAAGALLDFDDVFSRVALVLAWVVAVFTLPLSHVITRWVLARHGSYGTSTDLIGTANLTVPLATHLRTNPLAGFRPTNEYEGVPRGIGTREQCIIVTSTQVDATELLEAAASVYRRVILIREPDTTPYWFTSREVMVGQVGLMTHNALLEPVAQVAKRVLDVAAVIVSLPITLPVAAFAAFAVWVTDGAPVLFGHTRVGRGGREFRVWKFRSMRRDAQEQLKRLLAEDPIARAQWAENQKLDPDPRVTRVGKFLRMSSVDELPQLWNVLMGEMGLVGPRAVTREEMDRYGDAAELYQRVLPGISGLWQVSGRSDTSYAERVRLDAAYVRGWSPWWDIVILARTVLVLARARGAK